MEEIILGIGLKNGLNQYLIDKMNIFFILVSLLICMSLIFFIKLKKKIFFFYLCFIAFMSSIIFAFYESRNFYSIGDMDFTVWKTWHGCYIIPFQYFGICKPQKDYLKLSNIGAIDIFIQSDSTLVIFADPHRDGYTEIKCNLKKYRYYTYAIGNGMEELEQSKQWIKLWKRYSSKYPSLSIDARDMNIEVRAEGEHEF